MIPRKGATQSQGHPRTFYEYRVTTSNRTAHTIRVKIQLRLRMKNYASYYSFRISHECKVNGVYQYATIKNDRRWWGHQWEGNYGTSSFGWRRGTYDYDGRKWHGWYTVFDKNVPFGINDTTLNIIPCITQPPITGLGGGGIYAPNNLDKSHWKGYKGSWRPFGRDELIGTYKNKIHGEDGCWLNNKNLEPLEGGYIGAYKRISNVKRVNVSPLRIDVANQDKQKINVSWDAIQGAKAYNIYIKGRGKVKCIRRVTDTTTNLNPKVELEVNRLEHNDKIRVAVEPIDSHGVTSSKKTWSDEVVYYEIPSIAPDNAYLISSRNKKNRILFKGEKATLYFSGNEDGSYPIEHYELVCLEYPSHKNTIRTNEQRSELFIQGIDTPNKDLTYELRAYNTLGYPVYLTDGGWYRFKVNFYGGIIYVYDGFTWLEGICYVYNKDGEWKEAEAVYVNNKSGEWKTL